jgi:membrane-bound inhibitor of C-type lysozyme
MVENTLTELCNESNTEVVQIQVGDFLSLITVNDKFLFLSQRI